ncbi:MAG: flagellar motor protein MotB [Burkholderiaceae bacterium]|nr:flagellar motor protein MotB [Burkholderiaceae bacterium]
MAIGADRKIQPIVIKRVKKVVHGHHGGAWKIAYADFVTAMMAFFLLMWLLGSTSTGDLSGISDYFRTPLKVALSGGQGSGDSSSLIKGGGEDLSRRVGQVRRTDTKSPRETINLQVLRDELIRQEKEKLTRLKERVEEVILRFPALRELKDQIRLDITADGLSIQIVDAQNRPMFASGSAVVQDYMKDLLRTIGGVLNEVDNPVSLTGHTDAAPYAGGYRGYSNWELSTDRANASRRELVAGGMKPEKVMRVMGLGQVLPLDKVDPYDPMNRRIAIVVLNQAAQERILNGTELDVRSPGELDRVLGTGAGGTTPPVGPGASGAIAPGAAASASGGQAGASPTPSADAVPAR